MANVSQNTLLGLGNPLLDISADADDTLLAKYGLESNNAILAEQKHMALYEELINCYPVHYIAGGGTQNVMRVAQWILETPKACTFFGCVGMDKYSQTMELKTKEAGVNVRYQYDTKHPTGTCAVVVTGNGTQRSLVANLAAAEHFSQDHLNLADNRSLLNEAKYYYVSAFFLVNAPETVLDVASHASEAKKTFGLNLSAPFLCEFFQEPMMKVYPYVDYLFGNESEAQKFAEVQRFGTSDLEQIALKAADLPKANPETSRTIIITQGANSILVARDGVVVSYPVARLPKEQIVDTNGAGDAFVGGFLAQLVQGKDIEECVRCATWAARQIIQVSGCTCSPGITYPSQ